MELSIIFVNWNSTAYLADSIRSVYECTRGLQFEIIVIDNASPAGDIDALKQEWREIVLIKSEQNIGFARANNLGFAHSTGDYVLFLNPDTKLVGPAISSMVDCMRSKPDSGIVGCKLLNSDGTVQTTSIQTFPTILNQILDIEHVRLKWPACPLWRIAPLFSGSREPVRVQMISGACLLLKRSVFEEVGGFSEDYFMYAEDIDLNFKVSRKGLSNYYVPGAQIIHYGGRSSARQRVSHWATIMKFRAMMVYFRKNRGRLYAALYRGTMGLAAVGRLCLLGLILPLTYLVGRKERVLWAAEKWATVLRCVVGLGRFAPEFR